MSQKKLSALSELAVLQADDLFYAVEDGAAAVDASQKVKASTLQTLFGLTFVTGPGSSTDHAVARFDLATGRLLQDSNVLLDDSDYLYDIARLGIGPNASPPLYPLHYQDDTLDFATGQYLAGIEATKTAVVTHENDIFYGRKLTADLKQPGRTICSPTVLNARTSFLDCSVGRST